MAVFSPQSLLEVLQRYPGVKRYWLAFSGGLDSTVLLHALVQLKQQLLPVTLHALHIDHGLQAESAQWSAHCRQICQQYDVPFVSRKAVLSIAAGDSVEEKAREARYQLLENYIEEGDILLTAQHEDDQAETFLLQALRGAGPKGLAAMPEIRRFGRGRQLRPLLAFGKAELHDYALRHGLSWVEDPSNLQMRFQRNYLRHQIIPLVRQRWPAASDALARAARHCAETLALVEELAEIDVTQVQWQANTWSRSEFNRLSEARRANLLRHLLARSGLPMPDQRRLRQIIVQLGQAAADRSPHIAWPGAELRCYQNRVYLMPPLPATATQQRLPWSVETVLPLPIGRLTATRGQGQGIALAAVARGQVEVRFRQGGERCRLPGRAYSKALKTLFQEWGVPPWLRGYVPLIYVDGHLAAVAGFCQCQPFAATATGDAWQIHWQPVPGLPDSHLVAQLSDVAKSGTL